MESSTFMQSNYTDNYNAIQLSLPLDLGIKIDPDDEVVSFLKALEGVNLKKLSEVIENDTKEKVALTEEQEQALLSFIKTDNVYHKYYDDVLILLKTGLRISELCELTVADIDFKNEVVTIDHQLIKSKEQGYYIETPKTKSETRQVPLSTETIKALQRVMKKRPKTEPFVIDGQSNFLFVNHKGKPKVAIDYITLFVRMVVECQIK